MFRTPLTRRRFLRSAAGTALATFVGRRADAKPALPALPLKAGARVAFLGDSIIRRAHSVPTAREMSSYARGEIFWARAYDQRFRADTWYDANDPYGRAVSGQPRPGAGFNGANQGLDSDHAIAEFTVPGTLERAAYALARDPDVVLLHVGTNDINSGTDAPTLIARLEQNLAAIRGAGKWAILSTIYPRATTGRWAWPAGNRRWQHRKAVNEYIVKLKGRDGVVVFDPNSLLTDHNAASGEEEWLPGFSSDGVHPGPRATAPAGRMLAQLLGAMIEAGRAPEPDRGNLIAAARLSGTGGSKGAGVTGPLADHWYAGVVTGATTVVLAKEPAEGIEKQVLTFAPSNDGRTNRWDTIALSAPEIALRAADISAGDWVQFGAYLEVSEWEGWVGHACQITQRQGNSVLWSTYAGKLGNRELELMPTGGYTGWWLSDPVQIVPGTDRIRPGFLVVDVLKNAAGAGTIKISRPFIRKVNDPRPDWKL